MNLPAPENNGAEKDVAVKQAVANSAAAQDIALDALPSTVQERLAEVLEGYLDDLEHGLSPAAEELVARHPDLAGPLRNHLASLDLVATVTARFCRLRNLPIVMHICVFCDDDGDKRRAPG
jgi:hypothetical protein